MSTNTEARNAPVRGPGNTTIADVVSSMLRKGSKLSMVDNGSVVAIVALDGEAKLMRAIYLEVTEQMAQLLGGVNEESDFE